MMITSLHAIHTKIYVGFLLLLYCFSINALDGFIPPNMLEDFCKASQSSEQTPPSYEVPAPIKKVVLATGTLVIGALATRKYFNRSLDLLRKEMNEHFRKVHTRFNTIDTQLTRIGNNVEKVDKNVNTTRQELTASLAAHSKAHQKAVSSSEQRVTEAITDAHAATGKKLDAIETKLDALTSQRRTDNITQQ